MTQSQMLDALRLIENEKSKNTKTATMRAIKMTQYLHNSDKDSGAFGRIVELASHTEKSRKKAVSIQGKADTSFKLVKNGKITYEPAEVKTNGGRIGSLLSGKAPKYVIYSMDFDNSSGCRKVEPVIMKTTDFINLLSDCGAIKSTNGKNPEPAIQVSSKKLYNRLMDYPIPYEPDTIYTEDDFEGLEI